MKLSVVVPLYRCSKSIAELSRLLVVTLDNLTHDYEIIFLNDGSPEHDWEIIKQCVSENEQIKGINLSRNFGQHYAITAGLEHSTGEWVVVMDGDLQDRPEEIPRLYQKAMEGYDIVFARRYERQDNPLKRLSSHLFYKTLGYLTDTQQDPAIANFGIYNRRVINAICSMKDNTRYFPTMVKWVGFHSTSIDVTHSKREEGETSYSLRKLFNLAIDVIVVFSDKPLKITVKLGFLISFVAILFASFYIYKYYNNEIEVMGWTTLTVSIWFLSGLIIFFLGIIGIYIGKVFDQVKGRPVYIVKEQLWKK